MGLILKNIFLTFPFYFLWNGLAPVYMTSLPQAYHQIPFFHCMGLLLLLAVLRLAVTPSQGIVKWANVKTSNRFKEFIDVN